MTETRADTMMLVLVVLVSVSTAQAGPPSSSGQVGISATVNHLWKRHKAASGTEQPATHAAAAPSSSDRCPTISSTSEPDSVITTSAIVPYEETYIAQLAVFESQASIPKIEDLDTPFCSFDSVTMSSSEVSACPIPLPPFGDETPFAPDCNELTAIAAVPVGTGLFSVFENLPLADIPALAVAVDVRQTETPADGMADNRGSGAMQTLFAQNIEPTPVIPTVPPAPAPENFPTESPLPSADPLFLKRFAELNKPMSDIGLTIPGTTGPLPKNYASQLEGMSHPVVMSGVDGWWEPRINRYPVPFFYQPLYFEERNLERCGQGYGFAQPFVSSAAFVKNTIFLPYHLVVTPPRSLVLSPGDCPSDARFPIFPH